MDKENLIHTVNGFYYIYLHNVLFIYFLRSVCLIGLEQKY
ncbi:hypothetical protein IMSAGC004_01572 [Bacteroidaceae bacterium]|nr:hypothetical protein IMSAGC004_01572 [Bacteroidaceae bacterium]